MPYADTPGVSYEPRQFAGGTQHRFRWETTSAGVAVLRAPQLIGKTIHHAVSQHQTSGSGTYTVALYDELDYDWLDSALATMTINTTTGKALAVYVTSGSVRWARPLYLGPAELYFRVSHTSGATYRGVTDFYELPGVANV